MTQHKVGTQEEWQAARDELLAEEKELTRRSDELARKRRELPWVPVEKEYSFETADGTRPLPELFDGRPQLLVYHFMLGRLPGLLIDRGQPERQSPPPESTRHHPDLLVEGALGQAPGLPEADGLELRLGFDGRPRLPP